MVVLLVFDSCNSYQAFIVFERELLKLQMKIEEKKYIWFMLKCLFSAHHFALLELKCLNSRFCIRNKL